MADEFIIRIATKEDVTNVFNLSNDETVRANSIHKSKIHWEEHINWFNNRIENEKEPFYIVETPSGDFIAQARFNREDDHFIISVSIDKKYRGKGLGSEVIKETSKKLNVKPIVAYIKNDNIASEKSFKKAGYKIEGSKVIDGVTYFRYIFN